MTDHHWRQKKIALWYLDGGLDWILVHFHYMEKSSEYMIQHSSIYVPQKKKIMQFWNDIRLIKWWQNYHFNEGHATLSPQTPKSFNKESTCCEEALCSPQLVKEIIKQQYNAQGTSYLCCLIQYLSLKRLDLCHNSHFVQNDDVFSYHHDCWFLPFSCHSKICRM